MRLIETHAYKTSDGVLFEDEQDAHNHQQDIIGEMLDDLMPDDPDGFLMRSVRHKMLMAQLGDKDLTNKIRKLYYALTFTQE